MVAPLLIDNIRARSIIEDCGYKTPCVTYTGNRHGSGYGYVYVSRKLGLRVPSERLRVHRVVWENEHGPIPEHLVIDHLCRNRACVNVDHLELVTRVENVIRGVSPPAMNAQKTHCIHGHELAGANLRVYAGRPGRTRRQCAACSTAANANRRTRLADAP